MAHNHLDPSFNQPLAYPIAEAASVIGIGKTTIYKLIAARRLDVVKLGRRTLVPAASLHRLISTDEIALKVREQANADA